MTSLLDPETLHNPYPFYSRLRDNGIYWDEGLGAWLISTYSDVRETLENDSVFTTKPLAKRAEPVMRGRVLAQMTGKEHAVKMSAVVRGLSGTILNDYYAPAVREAAEELLSGAVRKNNFDLVSDFGQQFAVLVTLKILDISPEHAGSVRKWHNGVTHFVTALSSTEEERNEDIALSAELERFLLPIIKERRINPGRDLISTLCSSDNGGMSDSEIVALSINILLAATEPSDKTLAYLVNHLLSAPRQMLEKACSDPKYMQNCIAETLRLTSPVQLIPRQLSTDYIFETKTLKEDDLVFCLIGSANRDSKVFTEPDDFNPNRPIMMGNRSFTGASNHLAFGKGLHFCVGAAFARMQLSVGAQVISQYLPRIRKNGEMVESGMYTRGPSSLPLKYEG